VIRKIRDEKCLSEIWNKVFSRKEDCEYFLPRNYCSKKILDEFTFSDIETDIKCEGIGCGEFERSRETSEY
jgi:hypothetical protein